jgi:MFS family permease
MSYRLDGSPERPIMSHSDWSVPLSSSLTPDYLPPPPRSVTPNLRARWLRVGFMGGMVLGPLLVLWIGQVSSENLRTLAIQGRSANGQVMVQR